MSNFDKQWRRIPNRFGLGLMGALIGYFLLMRATGYGHEYWLRAFNAVILFSIVLGAIKTYKQSSSASLYEDFFNYFKIGMRTALIGVAGFAVFVALYLDVIEPAFLIEVQTLENISPYLTPVTAAGIVFIEGFGSAFICSYLAIQILKKSTVENELEASTPQN